MIAELILATMAVTATDQTVPVTKGTKLTVNNFAGDVNIKTWDKDAVRVEVNHSDRETVDIKQVEQTLSIRSTSTRICPRNRPTAASSWTGSIPRTSISTP